MIQQMNIEMSNLLKIIDIKTPMSAKQIIINIVFGIILIDMFGFIAWIASGQIPVDNFYVGIITKTVLSLII